MYQPELGRFLQPDPKHFAAGDYNLYRYCHNDPVNRSDPTGLIDEGHMEPEALDATARGSQAILTRAYKEADYIISTGLDNLRNDPAGALGVALSVISRERITSTNLKPIIIGENMKDRVIPFAKEIGGAFYQARSKIPGNWMKNNIRWFKDKLRQDRKIIDIGRDPNRTDRSPYYEAEKKLLEEHKKK